MHVLRRFLLSPLHLRRMPVSMLQRNCKGSQATVFISCRWPILVYNNTPSLQRWVLRIFSISQLRCVCVFFFCFPLNNSWWRVGRIFCSQSQSSVGFSRSRETSRQSASVRTFFKFQFFDCIICTCTVAVHTYVVQATSGSHRRCFFFQWFFVFNFFCRFFIYYLLRFLFTFCFFGTDRKTAAAAAMLLPYVAGI